MTTSTPAFLLNASRFQHGEGLPDTRRSSEEDLQPSARLFRFRVRDTGQKFVRIGPIPLYHAPRFPPNHEIWPRSAVFCSLFKVFGADVTK